MIWPLVLLPFFSFSEVSTYKSGENTGLGKVERLDRSEKYLEDVSRKLSNLELEVSNLKAEMAELKQKLNELSPETRQNPSEVSP